MKEKWYADGRDLVKWGALVHLAKEQQVDEIVQIAMLTSEERAELEVNGKSFAIPNKVWGHFREFRDIARLGDEIGVKIEVLDQKFEHEKRNAYFDARVKDVEDRKNRKLIVFLDPDTGLQPEKSQVTEKHVRKKEVERLYNVLRLGDWLALYQHGWWPKERSWQEISKERFASTCGVHITRIMSFSASSSLDADGAAKDVVLLAVEKTN